MGHSRVWHRNDSHRNALAERFLEEEAGAARVNILRDDIDARHGQTVLAQPVSQSERRVVRSVTPHRARRNHLDQSACDAAPPQALRAPEGACVVVGRVSAAPLHGSAGREDPIIGTGLEFLDGDLNDGSRDPAFDDHTFVSTRWVTAKKG